MSQLARLWILVAVCAAASLGAQNQAEDRAFAQSVDSAEYVPGEVLVRLDDGVAASEVAPASLIRSVSAEGGFVRVAAPAGRESQLAEDLEGRPGVAYAELNPLKQPAWIPNDPEYARQWDMTMIGAEDAWDRTTGEGVTIAVLDTGVAFEEWNQYGRSPELMDATFRDPRDVHGDGTDHPYDHSGHGTHVTGTLVQDTNNGVGTAGLAPDATIIPVKVCQNFGCPSADIAAGVYWAVDHGADIINISLGGSIVAEVEREAFAYAEEQGVLVIAAAGNGGGDFIGDGELDYPAALETVVAVGAVDVEMNRTRYSNYGEGEGGPGMHLMAPGGNTRVDLDGDGFNDGILQNTYAFSCGGGPTDYKVFKSCLYHGTSMATPHVSGAAALILSEYPDLTLEKLRTVLTCSALDLGEPGEDEEYGSGLVQIDAALNDEDGDGRPDCLDGAAQVKFYTATGFVEPGGQTEITINGFVDGDPIGSYSVSVLFDSDALTVVSCTPQEGGSCETEGNLTTLENSVPGGQGGGFHAGRIRFQATEEFTLGSFLALSATATEHFSKDPSPVVTTEAAFLWIQEVPNTVPGDSDCDGAFDSADVVLALGGLADFASGFCGAYADVNCSGGIDLIDVLQMLTYLAEIEATVTTGCPVADTPTPTATPSETPMMSVTPTAT